MLFTSWVFWVFFPLVLAGYFLLRGRLRAQNAYLLVASCGFYCWWSWKFLALIALSPAIDYLVALRLDRRRPGTDELELARSSRRALLIVSLVANLGVLAVFKYFHFFEDSLVELLSTVFGREVHPTGLAIVLPIGISFHTFQSMSYTIDVYRGELRATTSPVEYATFVLFFPQLVAGPIARARDFLPQLARPRAFDGARFNEGG